MPLLTDAKWMTQDEFSRGTFYYDSFGARRVLGWLVTGRIFDNDRVPVVSVLVLIGLGVCVWRFRRTETARAMPAVGLLSMLLFFGRPTLGFVIDLLPGATDLFLRRYVTGVHLAGIYLAGIGGAWVGDEGDAPRAHARRAWLKPAFAAAALAILLIGGGHPGHGRAVLVRAQGRRVDLGAAGRASRPTARSSLRSSRRPRRRHPGASTAACDRTGRRRRSISCPRSPRC